MSSFRSFQIQRKTRETVLRIQFAPRSGVETLIELPNRLLGHFLDHLFKACGVSMEMVDLSWPGSWRFDHVVCEDVGQIVGRGFAEIHDQLSTSRGVPGRASASAVMDESVVESVISFEGRPRMEWSLPDEAAVDGFVDAWYDDNGSMTGWAMGTNLRQFFDGFVIGAKASLVVKVCSSGNLHHAYEAAFRSVGDCLGLALGIGSRAGRIAGDTSGFAGDAEYTVEALK